LNLIYFIEFKGRFQREIGSNFEWTGVNWAWEYIPNNFGLSFKVLKIKPCQGCWRKMMKRLVMEQWDLIHLAMMNRQKGSDN
jgi:hypothetical protein